jgi:hypothetical protein
MWTLVRLMYLGTPPTPLEILAYSGYSFVSFCLSTLCGWAFGSGLGWHIAWLYTSACMSVFLIRTFKQIMRIDAAQRGDGAVGALFPASRQCVLTALSQQAHSPRLPMFRSAPYVPFTGNGRCSICRLLDHGCYGSRETSQQVGKLDGIVMQRSDASGISALYLYVSTGTG